ncbi:acyl-CoA dehydrogenase domain-containing protein [Actinobacteria bacterium OK074]|nr:acyl-CoA dehydrogenase domain-containing protein [Actinobacteria bacterium OK074]
MDARFTAEQDDIRRAVRELLVKRCSSEDLRSAVDTPAGHDPALWTALAGQLGLPGLALPEAYGGVGATTAELALAAEELGRCLAPSPFLGTAVLAAPLLLALGTERQRTALLPEFASGALTATLAVPGDTLTAALGLLGPPSADWAGGGRSGGVQARQLGGTGKLGQQADRGWTLYGQVDHVLDGHSAGLLLVAAHTGGFARSRVLLFLVRGDAAGVVRVRRTALDATRPRGTVQLRDAPAELLGEEPYDVGGALAAVGEGAAAVLACEAVGAAGRILERTVEHVRQREQFGRPVGSFQAVKHRLADVYVEVQAARSAAYYAAWAASCGGEHVERVGGLALAQALEACHIAAAEGIQLHGGLGFTWEHDAHLYFKRAAGDGLLFGPVHRLRAHAADTAGVFAPPPRQEVGVR